MESRAVVILVIIISLCHKIDAKLNLIPRDTEVKINDSTYMNCSTSLQAHLVQWRHGSNYVYTAIGIFETYIDRFSIEINASTGACNLVIRSVRPSDAGKYECVEDEGFGETRSVQLIVLDADPVCISNMHSEGIIGPNSCGIEPEVVRHSCSVSYHGNIPPILQWKESGANQTVTDGLINVISRFNEVTNKLTMNSTLDLNNASFICQATRTSERQYSCSSDIIKITYALSSEVTVNMTMNDEVSCFANSSQSCSYKWKWFSGDDISTESINQILKPKKAGWHRCEATCSFGKSSCTVESIHAYVYSDTTTEVYSDTATSRQSLLVLLVLVVLLVAVVGLIFVIYYWRKKQIEKTEEKRKRKQEPEEMKKLMDGLPEIYKSAPELDQTIRPKPAEKENKEIRGLTILDRELFVICEKSILVEVYDSIKFSFRREWTLKELSRPQDMVSCSMKKCLYINNYIDNNQPSEIIRVDPNGILMKKWSTGDDWGWGLSVTRESNVILTILEKTKLNEYSPDSRDLKRKEIYIMSSPAGISYPWHAVKLKNGHFVVAHGNYKNADLHRVSAVNKRGKFEKSYAEKQGQPVGQMDRPCYLFVDGNGFVMVADQGKRRVLLLDSDLKCEKEFLTEENGLRRPMRILLDESNGRLFVADNERNNHRILIFKLGP